MMKRIIISIATAAASLLAAPGQTDGSRIAVKTNLLYDALLNANAGIEVTVAPRWSVDLSGNYNGWTLSHGRRWKHWMVQPELRRHFGDSLRGHFLAAHLVGGQFNTTLGGARRQGWAAGIGVGYGYRWRLGNRWGIEAELAVGYARYAYDKYPCAACGRKIAHRNKNYVGPTKAAINLVYYFGKTKNAAPAPDLPAMPELPVTEIAETSSAAVLPAFDFKLVDVPHSKVLTENLAGIARIQFKVNRTEIDPSVGANRRELESITAMLDSISGNLGMQIRRIELTGYASPEGSLPLNDRLAHGRTEALKSYIKDEARLPDSIITVRHVAEDWDGLQAAIAASPLPDKEALLAIARSDDAPDVRERALRRHAAAWAWISSEILPKLRRTEYRVEYQHRYEEREIQTLEEVNRCIADGNADAAARLLVDMPSSPEADYARGVVAALQHRYDEAQAWFVRASSRGVPEADDALRQLRENTNNL